MPSNSRTEAEPAPARYARLSAAIAEFRAAAAEHGWRPGVCDLHSEEAHKPQGVAPDMAFVSCHGRTHDACENFELGGGVSVIVSREATPEEAERESRHQPPCRLHRCAP